MQRTRESWQIVFVITAAVYALGAITFLVFMSATIEPWAVDKSTMTLELEVENEQLPAQLPSPAELVDNSDELQAKATELAQLA